MVAGKRVDSSGLVQAGQASSAKPKAGMRSFSGSSTGRKGEAGSIEPKAKMVRSLPRSSSGPGKQRRLFYNRPLHLSKQDFSAHLSKQLRQKLGKRSLPVREGDTVRLVRGGGKIAGKQGKITAILRTKKMVLIEGITRKKTDGTERQIPLRPSNLLLIGVDESEKKRFRKRAKAQKQLNIETATPGKAIGKTGEKGLAGVKG